MDSNTERSTLLALHRLPYRAGLKDLKFGQSIALPFVAVFSLLALDCAAAKPTSALQQQENGEDDEPTRGMDSGREPATRVQGGGADGRAFKLDRDYGLSPVVIRRALPGSHVDARGAQFSVSNSRNDNPTPDSDCSQGELKINPYPLGIYDAQNLTLSGGRFDGKIPDQSDWRATYCNSTAIGVYRSPSATLQDIRIRATWDALRFSRGSSNFKVRRVWVTSSRDDCIENDQLLDGRIEDSLFDGCFMGISIEPGTKADEFPGNGTLTLDGVLIKTAPFPYKDKTVSGVPFKTGESGMNLRIYNSVFSFGAPDFFGGARLARAWGKIVDCKDNVLLWPFSDALPETVPKPPACFKVIAGEAARTYWEDARTNWINCHADVGRFDDDPRADVTACKV